MRIIATRPETSTTAQAISAGKIVQLFPENHIALLAQLWETVEPIAMRVNTGEGIEAYRRSLEMFTLEQRLGHAVLSYVSDVMDGGHLRFFSGASGILWDDAMTGLRDMGASENALILSAAALRVGGSPSPLRAERNKFFERLSPRFDDLDAKFRTTGPLTHLQDYVRNNRAAFYFTKAVL